jgi:hypothetical protein
MVDFYLGSWFRHKQANAVVILRDGLFTEEQMNLHGMEVRDDGIFLRFGPAVAADKQESAERKSTGFVATEEKIVKPLEACNATVIEDDIESSFSEVSIVRGAYRRPANWRSAYSLDTVYTEPDYGIEMKTFSRNNSLAEFNS